MVGREPPRISGVWLYSGNLARERRVAIDREIVKQKISKIGQRVNSFAGTELAEQCGSESRRIDWLLIALLLGLAPGALFGMLIFSICHMQWRSKLKNPPVVTSPAPSLDSKLDDTAPEAHIDPELGAEVEKEPSEFIVYNGGPPEMC